MAITSRADVMKFLGRGLNMMHPNTNAASGGGTAAAAGCGFLFFGIGCNAIGTTYPSTLVGFPALPSPPNELLVDFLVSQCAATGRGGWLALIYQIGTLNLAATGNQLTHTSGVLPMLRKQFGVASQPVTLIPMVYITTATTVTAPIFRLRTVAGGAGYVDQDGNSIVGTLTMTMPAAATAAQSGYVIRLENGDSGVQDISNIEVTTAGSAGAATIFGVELLAPIPAITPGFTYNYDALFGGLGMCDINPAIPTSGNVTSYLALISTSSSGTSNIYFVISTVLNGT